MRERFQSMVLHGRGAFKNLSKAWEVESELVKLNKIIDKKLEQDGINNIYDIYKINPRIVQQKTSELPELMTEYLSLVVILFQASMEGIINNACHEKNKLPNPGENSFKQRWIKSLERVDAKKDDFNVYHKDFYKRFRNPLVHLGREDDLAKIEEINFKDVYLGMFAGWKAYAELYRKIGIPHNPDDAEKSWEIMCSPYDLPNKDSLNN